MNQGTTQDNLPELLDLPERPKILLVRFSALGDVIQTLPILPMLRERYPNAFVGWAIDSDLVPAIAGHELVDRIHPCNRKKWFKKLDPASCKSSIDDMKSFVSGVREVGYDVAIDAQGLFKTALLTYFSGAKHRIGFAHGRECSRFFYDRAYIDKETYFDPTIHHVDHMALLTRSVGSKAEYYSAPLPPVTPEIGAKINALLASGFKTDAPIVAIAPGTQWPSKLWSETHWVKLAQMILEKTDFNLLFVGSPGDKAVVARLLAQLPQSSKCFDVSGKTNIPELYAIFRKVTAAIASDTAPLHIAGAAETPYVFGLFGPTATIRTAPIGSPNTKLFSTEGQLSCQPCHKRVCPLGTDECMKLITAESVFQSLLESVPQTSAASAAR